MGKSNNELHLEHFKNARDTLGLFKRLINNVSFLGKVVEEFGFASLEVEKLAKLPVRPDKRYG